MNILLEQEGDNDRGIEIEEKTSDEFDLKYRTNLSLIENLFFLQTVIPTMKAYQLIYLSGRTITGQLLIMKLEKLRRDPLR